MKGQSTFPTALIAIATLIFAILLVYSIVVLFNQKPSEISEKIQDSEDSTLEDSSLWSYVNQVNSNSLCPYTYGPDTDQDGIIDLCDNCKDNFNPEQDDRDGDGKGDACDQVSRSGGTNGDDDDEDDSSDVICEDKSDCGSDGLIGDLFCSGNNTAQNYIRYTCEEPGTQDSICAQNLTVQIIQNCSFGCENGSCIPATPANITCSLDSQCGADGFISARTCSGLNVTQQYKDFTCVNPGMQNSSCSFTITNKTVQTCTDACSNGQCVEIACQNNSECNDNNSSTQDICVNPGTPQSTCVHNQLNITCSLDSQCGTNGLIGDRFCSGLDVFKKFRTWDCVNPATPQSYCTFSDQDQLLQTCDDACLNGTCQTIYCSADSQCGADGLTGTPFCLGNSIYRMFQDFTCVFPGLPGSYCSSESTQQVVDQCDYACLSGECIRCDTNSDCNDNNSSTIDSCLLPGTPFSYCQNTLVPICQDECLFASQAQCSGNGYQTCGNFDSDNCLEWSQLTQCSIGTICQDGQCITPQPQCTNDCVQGSSQCSGNGYLTCGNFDSDSCTEWSQVTQCSFGTICQSGQCITPICQNDCLPGQRQCSGNGFITCGNFDSDSCYEWSYSPIQCSFGTICQNGNCV